ncbi:hypothetical protein QCA50_006793 [Cerrena zonata]|uniref:Serine hydrolase domain-containing protein n=1 Tax=Cerrena zonata TaxID=2478898 RepID=A0AAW0GKH9_9APHY
MSGAKKVLMLHGYAQSAIIFTKRLGALRKACGKDIDFVFVDAPHILSPADIAETFNTTQELGAAEADETDPAMLPRAWWRADKERKRTDGLEASLIYLRDILKKDHYEGVFGFSQGACMAAVLTALLERPHVFPDFLVDGQPPHPPFTFCIAAAGFKPVSALSDTIISTSFSTPTLHIMGKTDVIVPEERAQSLLEVTSNKRIEVHDGGHFIPSKANWRNFIKAYLKDPLGDIPSPGAAGISQPASGTATPVPN